MDLWIAQPGAHACLTQVTYLLSLWEVIGARGHMPEELGELIELRSLILGSHKDAIYSSPIHSIHYPELTDSGPTRRLRAS
jgi:hypothetical protein